MANNPKNYNDTSPSAPSGKTNVKWQAATPDADPTVVRDVSAYVDSVIEAQLSLTDITTANVSTSKHGLAPKLPNDSTKFLDGTGVYSVPGGGSSSIKSGSNIIVGGTIGTNNANWNNWTMRFVMRHCGLQCLPASWKVRLCFTGGTGAHISKAMVKRTAKDSATFIDSTNFTFNGGSMPYNFAFGRTASTSAPVYLDSDAISIQLDSDHDYWVYIYFDNDAAGSNFNTSVGFNSYTSISVNFVSGENHSNSDATGDATAPTATSTVTLIKQVLAG